MIACRSFLVLVGLAWLGLMLFAIGCLHTSAPNVDRTVDQNNPLGPNAACYVCHMTYVKEPLSRLHLRHKVYCIDCHGPSIGHANDEDIGATKPDIYFKRDKVNASCRKCHSDHNAAPEKVVKRWFDRKLKTNSPICTECHGQHKIKRAKDAKPAGK
jgi:predicted CXXCH cytochrome family protein